MMRLAISGLVLLLLALVVSCGGANVSPSMFWDTGGEVIGQHWDFPGPGLSLPETVEYADAIVVVRVTGIDHVELPNTDYSGIIYANPADKERYEALNKISDAVPNATTYSGEVDQWIKGSGGSSIPITAYGGISAYDGTAVFLDEFFLLEPGRSYLLLLNRDTEQQRWDLGSARQSFDITDGVKVLNNPASHNLEYLEDLSVDELISQVRELATAAAAKSN